MPQDSNAPSATTRDGGETPDFEAAEQVAARLAKAKEVGSWSPEAIAMVGNLARAYLDRHEGVKALAEEVARRAMVESQLRKEIESIRAPVPASGSEEGVTDAFADVIAESGSLENNGHPLTDIAERERNRAHFRAALDRYTQALRALASRPAVVAPQAVAWEYELATAITDAGEYVNWRAPVLSHQKPNVPEGSIRNLRPLTYASPVPSVAALARALDAKGG